MRAKYEFKVGAANRNINYAKPVSVYADSYAEAVSKAKQLFGYVRNPYDAKVWLMSVEEDA